MAVRDPKEGQLVRDMRSGNRRIITEIKKGRAYLRSVEPEARHSGSWGLKLMHGSLPRHTALTEPYTTGTGQEMWVHGEGLCAGTNCMIHNPSKHALREAPTHWRDDREIMERICPHGVGHPDPDGVEFVRRTQGEEAVFGYSVHGCDGCCAD